MLAEAVVISFIIGLLSGGSLKRLSHLEMNLMYLPMVAFALEFIGGKLLSNNYDIFMQNKDLWTLMIELLVYMTLSYFFYKNRHLPGMMILLGGTLLNFVVIISNSGYMPVDPTLGIKYGYETSLAMLKNGEVFAHEVTGESTVLAVLSDWIIIPPPWPMPKTISIGDIIIDVGAFILIFKGMHTGQTKKNSI